MPHQRYFLPSQQKTRRERGEGNRRRNYTAHRHSDTAQVRPCGCASDASAAGLDARTASLGPRLGIAPHKNRGFKAPQDAQQHELLISVVVRQTQLQLDYRFVRRFQRIRLMPTEVASHALQTLIGAPQRGDSVTNLRMQLRRRRGRRCKRETQCQNKR
jgi:hypothetical protein